MSGADEILNELQSLKAEVVRLSKEKTDRFRSSSRAQAEALAGEVRKNLMDLESVLQEQEQDFEKAVAKHPVPALAVALGVGFAIGLSMRKIV